VALDGPRHLMEMPLELVDHVIRQQRLGEGREAPKVGEEDRNAQLLADRSRLAARQRRHPGGRPSPLRGSSTTGARA
jgi:hypothetical protein